MDEINTSNWMAPHTAWVSHQRVNATDLPHDLDLDTVDGMREWLSHPSNWVETDLFIIRFDGLSPKISSSHVWKLATGCNEALFLLDVVLADRRNRRHKPSRGKFVDDDDDNDSSDNLF